MNEQLKSWCVSLLKDVHIQNQGQNYRLLPSSSSSVDKSGPEVEPESLPLLPLVSGGSSASLATYVNVVPSGSGGPGGLSLGQEPLRSRTYFEMKVDRSPGRSQQLCGAVSVCLLNSCKSVSFVFRQTWSDLTLTQFVEVTVAV